MRNKNKKIGSLCFLLLLFGLPILSPAIESSFSFTNNVVGLETSANAYFSAISEANNPTRWILQGAEITAFENFTDDISGGNWYLTDVASRDFNWVKYTPTDDSWVEFDNPDANYGGDTILSSKNFVPTTLYELTYLKFDLSGSLDYFGDNDTTYSIGLYSVDGIGQHNLYETTTFDEDFITYTTRPALGDLEDVMTFDFPHIDTWVYWEPSDLNDGIFAVYGVSGSGMVGNFHSKENSNDPKFIRGISKEYFGGGYMYMQTGSTESIGLQSTDYTTHYTLNSGDYFEIDFETSSNSEISLILLEGGGVNKTLILSPSGNTNFNRHTVQVSVDETVEFDQLKISSTFEAKDKIKIYDIKTFKYTITGDYFDFNVGSNSDREINLTADTYNLRIFDPYDGDVKVNVNITIESPYDDYIYDPTNTIDCRLTLFNIGKENHLDFEDYYISINRSLNGEWDLFDLLSNIFTADVGTHVYIDVSDRFDTLIDSIDKIASSYIDIELEVYQLQLKNLMLQRTTIDVNTTHVYPLLSGNYIDFVLLKEYYQIGYYDTNNAYKQFTIYLGSNQAYELNNSQICFLSYTDQQGNHLFFEDYMTYLNGSLIYEKVFYEEIGTDVHINITDRYGINIYAETYTVLSENNYIPIILDLYELKLKNLQNEFNRIIITRAPYPIVGTVGDIVESGHFPATYSFTDEADGTTEEDMDFIDLFQKADAGTATIIEELDGHRKIIEAYSDSAYFRIYNDFSSGQTSGTIELWIRSTDTAGYTIIDIEESGTSCVRLFWVNDKLYHDDGAWQELANVVDDTWYHIKIVFNCATDIFDLYLDGVKELTGGAFKVVADSLDRIRLSSGSAIDYYSYFDAIGFSWDSEYLLGDNYHDNFYLGYDSFEQYNKTEYGDYYGTDSFDYRTEEGVYYGTHDFRDDAIGGDPAGWDIVETGGTMNVISELDGHKKVVEMDDTDGGNYVEMHNHFDSQTSGTVEFWIQSEDVSFSSQFWFTGSGSGPLILIDADKIQYHNGTAWNDATGGGVLDDIWYHFKIIFDCTPDTYDFYLDGVLLDVDIPFSNVQTNVNKLSFRSSSADLNYKSYIDAVGYSWDTTSHSGLGYTVGYNINPYDIEPLLENDFVFYLVYGSSVSVVNNLDGHDNDLNVTGVWGDNTRVYKDFTQQTDGTIDFWYYVSSIDTNYIQITQDYGTGLGVWMSLNAGTMQYFNGTDWNTISSPIISEQWYHFRIDFDCVSDTFSVWLNGTQLSDDYGTDFGFRGVVAYVNCIGSYNPSAKSVYFDALGYDWDSNYDVGDNINSHGKEVITALEDEGWVVNNAPFADVGISGEFNLYKKFLNLTDDTTDHISEVINTFTERLTGTFEFWVSITEINDYGDFGVYDGSVMDGAHLSFFNDGFIKYYDGAWHPLQSYLADTWYHIKIEFDCSVGKFYIWINDISMDGGAGYDFRTDGAGVVKMDNVRFATNVPAEGVSFYIDALAYSWISGYYIGDNYNYYDVDSEYEWTTNIAPDEIVSFGLLKGFYNIWMTNSEETISFSFRMFDDNYFILNRSQMCFLSYTNQRGEYLNFNQFKTYWNGTLLYENVFYERIGRNASLEIKDHYDISVMNHSFIVSAGDNYVPIILTRYSLKVMNQQEAFNHINITRDPNHYESEYYWSEWIAPNEIVEFKLFAGHYVFNITDTENGWSSYEYELNGDDVLLMSSDNIISNVIYNIANVNTTIGNQITNVQIDLTNQNSNINNTIINIDINLSNVNSTLGTLLTNINLDIININNNISELYTFTENNFLNLGNNINNSFTLIENNIISINQTISTLVIGLDGKITIVNATINTMFTEMNSQFIVVQSTLDFSFAFLNQTIIQIGNNITSNQIALNNLIIQRANDIDTNIIQIQNLINLLNSTVANESLVVQTLINIIGSNITENYVAINSLVSLIGNNITENNVNLVNLIELVGNNITTNHFVIQTLIDYVSNNITDNHLEVLTNINFINTTINQNQIELINRLLFINNSINDMALDLTNQILLVNNTIYSAILDVSVSIDFNSDNILGNISLTYEQNDFLTELYKETMFSSLLNWSDVAFNYSLMEDRIDVWTFVNDYKNTSLIVELMYGDIIDELLLSAQFTIDQWLPSTNVSYRVWSVEDGKYLSDWVALPDNETISFGFYEEVIPEIPEFNAPNTVLMIILILIACIIPIVIIGYVANRYRKKSELYRKSYADKITLEAQTIKKFSQGRRIR